MGERKYLHRHVVFFTREKMVGKDMKVACGIT